jgi:hypothetical protein
MKEETRETPSLTLPVEELESVSDTYSPDGYKTPEEYLDDLRETYELDLQADDDNRKAAIEDKKFVAGEQWDPIVLQQRQGLPCLTINTIPQFTAQITGDWRENRVGVKVLPAENGDKNTADVRSDLIRSIETKSRADRVYTSAFESMVQCSDGAFRVAVTYTSDDVFDQDIVLEPIDDALSTVWDRLSVDPTGRDARHVFVDDLMPRKDFEEQWPEADPSTLSKREERSLTQSGWLDEGNVRVTEHWRLIERKKLLLMFQDGTLYSVDENMHEEYDALVNKHGQPVKSRLSPCTYAQMHLVTGFKILAGPYEYKLSRLPIIRMSGRVVSIGDRRVRYGLVRYMKDAARLRNFWRSVAAEQLGYAPKSVWMATESAVEGKEDTIRKSHKTRDPLLIFNDEAIFDQNVKRVDPPQMQTALLQEAQINTQDMKDITGIHDASLGIKSNETSGRAIMSRQREGDIASLAYYDNGNAAILEAGDVMNQLIPQIYDGTRIIRIIGEDESTKFVSINDPSNPASPNLAVGKYDVAMSTGASYTTRRVEAAESMMEAIQVYPELMQIAGDLVVKAQDWPGAEELAERLIKTVPPQLLSDKEKAEMGNQPDMQGIMQQQAQQGEQLQQAMQELQQLQQENLVLKAKHDIESKKLEIDQFKAETDRMTAYGVILKADAELDLKQLEQEAHQTLEQEESEHDRIMDVAGHLQNQDQFEQSQQAEAEQAKASAADSTPSAE